MIDPNEINKALEKGEKDDSLIDAFLKMFDNGNN